MLKLKDKLYIATFSDDAVKVAAEYGLRLELNHVCISENLDEENICATIKGIEGDMKAAGDRDVILHGPFTELCPGSIDHRAVELAMERLNQAYAVAAHFDIKKMVVHTGYLPLLYYKEWHLEKSMTFWKTFMADKPADFELAIENVFEDEPYMLKDLAERIDDPRVGLCLDIGHANAMRRKGALSIGSAAGGETSQPESVGVPEWIRVLGKYIKHFHIHNNDGNADLHDSLARGEMDMDKIFDCIEKYCDDKVTFTIESRTCEDVVKWLREKKYE